MVNYYWIIVTKRKGHRDYGNTDVEGDSESV